MEFVLKLLPRYLRHNFTATNSAQLPRIFSGTADIGFISVHLYFYCSFFQF